MSEPGLHVDVDELVAGHLYVFYSTNSVRMPGGMSTGTTNVYLARLRGSGVMIFGSGFGDSESDHEAYNFDRNFIARSASHDADRISHVVRRCMGITGRVDVTFVAPHAHLDHLNQEILLELDSRGLGPNEVWVHANDWERARCGRACCGRAPLGSAGCDEPRDLDFGAPFDPPWEPEWLGRMVRLGGSGETACVTSLRTLETEALGPLSVVWNDQHTGGVLDVVTRTDAPFAIYLSGASEGCRTQRMAYPVAPNAHGNVVVP